MRLYLLNSVFLLLCRFCSPFVFCMLCCVAVGFCPFSFFRPILLPPLARIFFLFDVTLMRRISSYLFLSSSFSPFMLLFEKRRRSKRIVFSLFLILFFPSYYFSQLQRVPFVFEFILYCLCFHRPVSLNVPRFKMLVLVVRFVYPTSYLNFIFPPPRLICNPPGSSRFCQVFLG